MPRFKPDADAIGELRAAVKKIKDESTSTTRSYPAPSPYADPYSSGTPYSYPPDMGSSGTTGLITGTLGAGTTISAPGSYAFKTGASTDITAAPKVTVTLVSDTGAVLNITDLVDKAYVDGYSVAVHLKPRVELALTASKVAGSTILTFRDETEGTHIEHYLYDPDDYDPEDGSDA